MSKRDVVKSLFDTESLDYKQLLRLVASIVAKTDKSVREYAVNLQAENLVNAKFFLRGFLSEENYDFLLKYIKELGKAQFIAQLDALSQLVMKIQKSREENKRERREKDFEETLQSLLNQSSQQ